LPAFFDLLRETLAQGHDASQRHLVPHRWWRVPSSDFSWSVAISITVVRCLNVPREGGADAATPLPDKGGGSDIASRIDSNFKPLNSGRTYTPRNADAPEVMLHRSARRGRGECRAPIAPAASHGKNKNHTSVVTTVAPESPGIPAREWF
jgi:hypothetical protein